MVNIWIQDFGVLFDKKYLIDFIPRADMSYNEKINSLVRFSLYLSIILSIIKGNIAYLYIFILTLVMTYMFFMFNKKNEKIEQFSNNREQFSNNREQFSNNREQFSNNREQFSNNREQFSNNIEQFSNDAQEPTGLSKLLDNKKELEESNSERYFNKIVNGNESFHNIHMIAPNHKRSAVFDKAGDGKFSDLFYHETEGYANPNSGTNHGEIDFDIDSNHVDDISRGHRNLHNN